MVKTAFEPFDDILSCLHACCSSISVSFSVDSSALVYTALETTIAAICFPKRVKVNETDASLEQAGWRLVKKTL